MRFTAKRTIELDQVVPDRLIPSSTGRFVVNATGPLSLKLHPEHDSSNGERRANQHDTESAKRPVVIDLLVEKLGNGRATECARDHRGIVDAEDDHAILKGGHIGNHNVDDIL